MSLAVKVTEVVRPLWMVLFPTLTKELARETLPGVTTILGCGIVVTLIPPMLALMVVAVPAAKPTKAAE